jgi:hypothetical protein
MIRAVKRFIASPAHSFPALAAVIGVLVSGYSTFNGISEIFPVFAYSALAALGLAVIIQMGMVTSVLGYREQVKFRPAFGFIIAFTVLMSSFTSYVFYYRGYSEETITNEQRTERWESLHSYLGDVRLQTAAALGTSREAAAELGKRIEIEEGSGGGLKNLSNPYLQQLIRESDVDINLGEVRGGQGERFKFLSSVLPRIQQAEADLSESLAVIDTAMAALTGVEIAAVPESTDLGAGAADEALADNAAGGRERTNRAARTAELDDAGLRALYARASAAVPVERIREVRGTFTPVAVDPALLDTSPLEEEEYWQRAVNGLLVERAPAAVVFAAMAVFIDLMIVFFAFIAGESEREPVGPRYSMRHWFELAYGPRTSEAAGRWLAAMNGDTYHKNGSFHGIELATLTDPRDLQCRTFLRQDGYLSQLALEHGRAPWTLLDSGYWELVDFVKATGRVDAAAETPAGAPADAGFGGAPNVLPGASEAPSTNA